MNQKAPAGWYDDPAGSGGQRFWNGQAWTERVEGAKSASGRASSDRLPEGYMMLNGEQVPIGHSLPEQPRRNLNGALLIGLAAIVAVIVLALFGSELESGFEFPAPETTSGTDLLDEDPWDDDEWETIP
ncbi:DUF2510 domain-containing protein [Aeromicrobium duanguangcaii]|uniref:DUF2510 domain-containing protein n=1 Tax=Aeromicrobium duanguangcaii TaxID=2968086 RepID=UPI002017979E|nr:DUF2510 domain-containing protein [Aeromicrobium duanguangcaii]